MKLTGKVAIITGAGQGIGEAYAKRFAAEGATVVVAASTGVEARALGSGDSEGRRTQASERRGQVHFGLCGHHLVMATVQPSCSVPTTFTAGTRTASKKT